jgi:hypothetical protein
MKPYTPQYNQIRNVTHPIQYLSRCSLLVDRSVTRFAMEIRAYDTRNTGTTTV